METAVGGDTITDGLGRKHQLIAVQPAQRRGASLIPDDPRDAVARPRKRDVWLDSVARRVDVQARVRGARPDARDADLLPAEPADRRNVTRNHDPRGPHAL